ncbi:MAG: adenosylcobinamide-GDP ribazoletransferase [Candidatus Caldatribacterium sp.]|nr:adenosylcobinamide-GDP ribazoletransferase [Candidatus Caldatribacterium sp.]
MKRLVRLLRFAVSFLTPFPVGSGNYEPGDLAQSAVFFPLVGLGIGALLSFTRSSLLKWTGDSLLAAFVTLFAWILLTRGLHIDGVADVCDALFAPKGKRELILKDPRVGTFGVLGILFVLGAKGVVLARLSGGVFPLLLAPVFGRAVALLFGAFFRALPREERGLAEEFVGRVPKLAFVLWAFGIGGMGFLALGWRGVLKTALSFGIMFTLGRGMARFFGGLNGDMVGAGIEWGEAIWLFLWRM